MKTTLIFLITVMLGGVVLSSLSEAPDLSYDWPAFQKGLVDFASIELESSATTSGLFFGGDVLLARDVERILSIYGADYPYKHLSELWSGVDAVIVNFESTIPVIHVPTPDLTTSFSTPRELLTDLRTAGVSHVSLANNHSFDKGTDGFLETMQHLEMAGLQTFGDPRVLADISTTYIDYADERVAILGLHTLDAVYTDQEIQESISVASAESDLQIAYIHWGTEYDLEHNASQRELAETLIDNGIDMVIGHHPHVVQDIEVYNEKLIVYSLGNLIFDQYFSTEVQEGLLLELTPSEDGEVNLNLIPVTSVGSRAQPRAMADRERDLWLQDLALRSDEILAVSISAGTIELSEDLAISPRLP